MGEDNIFCFFEFGDYKLELTVPLSPLTEGQVRGATDLYLKFLGHQLIAELEDKEK